MANAKPLLDLRGHEPQEDKSLVPLTAPVSPAAEVCYTGRFSIMSNSGSIKLQYVIDNDTLHVETLNPDEVLTLNNGETKPVSQVFNPGPDMKLIPMDGVKCPCLALQTEKKNFNFIVEHKSDGSDIATMDYFGLTRGTVETQRCNK